jgi:hypothetical protein
MEKLRKDKKDTYYLEVDKIFPVQSISLEETEFLINCLEKLLVDIEVGEDIILSTNQLMLLITARMRLTKENL